MVVFPKECEIMGDGRKMDWGAAFWLISVSSRIDELSGWRPRGGEGLSGNLQLSDTNLHASRVSASI